MLTAKKIDGYFQREWEETTKKRKSKLEEIQIQKIPKTTVT